MEFREQHSQPMTTQTKAEYKINEGKAKIEKTARDIAANSQVQKGLATAKEGARRAKDGLLGLIGMGDESSQPTQSLQGGKRRRKSRRKKRRTKRRRKSRRKRRR